MTHAARATAEEVELRRRLGALATVATLATVDDDDAWADLQERIGRDRPRRLRPTPRTLAAVAAVIVVLCAVAIFGHDSRQQVETVDEVTTTTREGATGSSSTTTSSTAADPEDPPLPVGPGAAPDGAGRGGVVGGGGAPGDAGADGGSTPGGTGGSGSSGAGSGSPGTDPATTAPPATVAPTPGPLPVTAPDGRPVAVNLVTADYALQGTLTELSTAYLHVGIWRPDRGHVTEWTVDVAARPGARCLAGRNGPAFAFPEPGLHAYSWGIVGPGVAQVRIVSTSGEVTTAVIGSEAVPGLRPWIGRRYTDQIDRFEALDAGGNVVYTASWSTSFAAPSGAC